MHSLSWNLSSRSTTKLLRYTMGVSTKLRKPPSEQGMNSVSRCWCRHHRLLHHYPQGSRMKGHYSQCIIRFLLSFFHPLWAYTRSDSEGRCNDAVEPSLSSPKKQKCLPAFFYPRKSYITYRYRTCKEQTLGHHLRGSRTTQEPHSPYWAGFGRCNTGLPGQWETKMNTYTVPVVIVEYKRSTHVLFDRRKKNPLLPSPFPAKTEKVIRQHICVFKYHKKSKPQNFLTYGCAWQQSRCHHYHWQVI
jgi:hypothetical protein